MYSHSCCSQRIKIIGLSCVAALAITACSADPEPKMDPRLAGLSPTALKYVWTEKNPLGNRNCVGCHQFKKDVIYPSWGEMQAHYRQFKREDAIEFIVGLSIHGSSETPNSKKVNAFSPKYSKMGSLHYYSGYSPKEEAAIREVAAWILDHDASLGVNKK